VLEVWLLETKQNCYKNYKEEKSTVVVKTSIEDYEKSKLIREKWKNFKVTAKVIIMMKLRQT